MNEIIQQLKEHAKSAVILLSQGEAPAVALIELSGAVDACDRADRAWRKHEAAIPKPVSRVAQ